MAGEEAKGVQDSSSIFTKSIMEHIHREDVISMVHAQREMLIRYEKTNEMLLNFNMLSGSRYETTIQEFRKHTQLLYEMKRDLDAIFRRIRQVKGRLSTLHPAAFSACSDVYNVLEEGESDKEEGEVTGSQMNVTTTTETANTGETTTVMANSSETTTVTTNTSKTTTTVTANTAKTSQPAKHSEEAKVEDDVASLT